MKGRQHERQERLVSLAVYGMNRIGTNRRMFHNSENDGESIRRFFLFHLYFWYDRKIAYCIDSRSNLVEDNV